MGERWFGAVMFLAQFAIICLVIRGIAWLAQADFRKKRILKRILK